MAVIKNSVYCSYCGTKDSVNVITKQTKHSRSVKVTKCSECGIQNGVLQSLKNKL